MAVSMAAGLDHLVLSTDGGNVFACGRNAFGQLGVQGPCLEHNGKLQQVVGLSGVQQVAAGHQTSHALTKEGGVFSWGNAEHGSLGVPMDPEDHISVCPLPKRSFFPEDTILIGAAGRLCWGVTKNGRVRVCGENDVVQAGLDSGGQNLLVPMPLNLPDGHRALQFSSSGRHSLLFAQDEKEAQQSLWTCRSSGRSQNNSHMFCAICGAMAAGGGVLDPEPTAANDSNAASDGGLLDPAPTDDKETGTSDSNNLTASASKSVAPNGGMGAPNSKNSTTSLSESAVEPDGGSLDGVSNRNNANATAAKSPSTRKGKRRASPPKKSRSSTRIREMRQRTHQEQCMQCFAFLVQAVSVACSIVNASMMQQFIIRNIILSTCQNEQLVYFQRNGMLREGWV